MKFQKDELLEKIKKLNKEKPLKEGKEIQRVLAPADADAVEQHEEALKANKERLDPKNYEKDVKDLIEDTASEESRYRHFDVVDRKDLAKKINEAKEKKIPFKVARSVKEGFRYDFSLLKEEFIKKDAGGPEVNKDAFNKATDIDASSPSTGLGEDFEGSKGYVQISTSRDNYSAKECLASTFTVGELIDYLSSEFPEDAPIVLSFDRGYTYGCVDDHMFEFIEDESLEECNKKLIKGDLSEELKIYTSSLDTFHPSKEAEELWDEIKEANKLEDLEYALETLYPDGISDEALDDMLIHEEDWIRDLISLPIADEESEEDEEEPIDEFDAEEEIEPVESEEDTVDDIEPVDYEEVEETPEEEDAPEEEVEEGLTLESKSNGMSPKMAKLKHLLMGESVETANQSEEEIDDSIDVSPKKELKEEVEEEKSNEEKQPEVEEDDEQLSKLAEGFVNSQFKQNDGTAEQSAETEVKEAIKSSEDDDEIVAVDDSMVEDMLGMPKEEKK